MAARVRNGSSELGFAELPLASDDLEARPLGAQEYVALVPASLDAEMAGAGTLSIRALARQPQVTTPPGTSTRRQLDEALATLGLTAIIAVETDHREALAPLVRAGAGVAVLPRALAGDSSTPDVVIREIRPKIVREIGLVHRPGSLSPAAHRFVTLAVGGGAERTRPRPRRR